MDAPSNPSPTLAEADRRLAAPVIVLSRDVEDQLVTLTYRVGAERGTAECRIDEDRDDRGPLPYVYSTSSDHDNDARVVEALEAEALAAWEHHTAGAAEAPSEQWFASHGTFTPHRRPGRRQRVSSVTQPMPRLSMAELVWGELAGKAGAR